MGGDREHRLVVAVAVEQAIDEMQVAGPTTARTHREASGGRRLGTRREGCHFFMAHMHPGDLADPTQAVAQAVEAIAGDAPDALDAGIDKVVATRSAIVAMSALLFRRLCRRRRRSEPAGGRRNLGVFEPRRQNANSARSWNTSALRTVGSVLGWITYWKSGWIASQSLIWARYVTSKANSARLTGIACCSCACM